MLLQFGVSLIDMFMPLLLCLMPICNYDEANETNIYSAEYLLSSEDDSDVIGRGTYGIVRRCEWHLRGKPRFVAVKCIFGNGSVEYYEKIKNEVQQLCKFKHKNVLEVYGLTSPSKLDYGIICEEIRCRNLKDLRILTSRNKPISWSLKHRIFSDIASGIEYLHKQKCIHLDLKPENILIADGIIPKIADFGSVQIVKSTENKQMDCYQCTELYAAPELLNNLVKNEDKFLLDVYSYSMIGYEIITDTQVYQCDRSHNQVVFAIRYHKTKPDETKLNKIEEKLQSTSINLKIFKTLRLIVENCWEDEPKNRPTITKVRSMLETRDMGLSISIDKQEEKSLTDLLRTKRNSNVVRITLQKHFQKNSNLIRCSSPEIMMPLILDTNQGDSSSGNQDGHNKKIPFWRWLSNQYCKRVAVIGLTVWVFVASVFLVLDFRNRRHELTNPSEGTYNVVCGKHTSIPCSLHADIRVNLSWQKEVFPGGMEVLPTIEDSRKLSNVKSEYQIIFANTTTLLTINKSLDFSNYTCKEKMQDLIVASCGPTSSFSIPESNSTIATNTTQSIHCFFYNRLVATTTVFGFLVWTTTSLIILAVAILVLRYCMKKKLCTKQSRTYESLEH